MVAAQKYAISTTDFRGRALASRRTAKIELPLLQPQMTQMAQICLMAFYIFCENLCESVVKPWQSQMAMNYYISTFIASLT